MNRKNVKDPETNRINSDDETSSAIDTSVATYYDLSNHLRHAVSRGYPKSARKSHKQTVHNLELSQMFLADKENVESPYRRKKDWLCKMLIY